jgi:hypothetical protein
MAHAPDELSADIALTVDPAKQQRVIELDVCYCGPPADAERMVAPLRKLGKPLRDELGPAAYVKLQGSDAPPGPSIGAYVKGGLVYGLTPALIDAAVDYIEAHPANNFEIEFGANGGAVGRVAPQNTAFWGRGASHTMLAFAFWRVPPGEGAAESTAWVRGAWTQLEPHTRGNYVNLASTDDRESRVHAAYGDNYARLAALKKRYDPANLFQLNANIKPA